MVLLCKTMISPFFHDFFWVVTGVKVQKMAQNNKKSCSYLRNCTLYDCHLWYTCVKWYLQEFFQIFKILVFCVVFGLPKKKAQNDKNFICYLIGIHSMQGWTATTRHAVSRKRNIKICFDNHASFDCHV